MRNTLWYSVPRGPGLKSTCVHLSADGAQSGTKVTRIDMEATKRAGTGPVVPEELSL